MTPTNQLRAEASTTIDGVRHEFPVLKGTLGSDVIDIGALYQNTGHFAYDPGFMSTASCNERSPSSMAIRASYFIAATPSIS